MNQVEQSLASRQFLVTGPARSGKSEWAEWLAMETAQEVVYVATAQRDLDDTEWQERIQLHQQRRPVEWMTVEVSYDLHRLIRVALPSQCLLIDSLGTWLVHFLDLDDRTWEPLEAQLLEAMQACVATLIFVAEEVGWGVVPSYPLGRCFRDRLGRLVRRVAKSVDTTYLVTGGHVLNLSQLGNPLP